MSNATHPDLDLTGTIRPGLDILANEIVVALKKRTRFPRNPAVYSPGLVLNQPSISLLQHVLYRQEQCHAELERYTFAMQDAFTDISDVEPVIQRDIPKSPVLAIPSGAGPRIIKFYQEWVTLACAEGENASTYGEAVTSDVNALLAIMERVNLGKSVAEAKFLEMPQRFIDTGGDRDAMLELIVRSDREVKVLELAKNLANHYELAADHTVDVFNFMIATTIDIEVDYLRLRIASTADS